jgi:hypothetical protein
MVDDPQDTSQTPQPDDEYPLGPVEPQRAKHDSSSELVDIDELLESARPEQPSFQFSMAELFLLVALVSFVLGLLNCIPPQYAAGLAGLGALVSMVVIAVLKPTRPIIYLAWWVVLGIYLLSCLRGLLAGS